MTNYLYREAKNTYRLYRLYKNIPRPKLKNIKDIYLNENSFIALSEDDQLFMWGGIPDYIKKEKLQK